MAPAAPPARTDDPAANEHALAAALRDVDALDPADLATAGRYDCRWGWVIVLRHKGAEVLLDSTTARAAELDAFPRFWLDRTPMTDAERKWVQLARVTWVRSREEERRCAGEPPTTHTSLSMRFGAPGEFRDSTGSSDDGLVRTVGDAAVGIGWVITGLGWNTTLCMEPARQRFFVYDTQSVDVETFPADMVPTPSRWSSGEVVTEADRVELRARFAAAATVARSTSGPTGRNVRPLSAEAKPGSGGALPVRSDPVFERSIGHADPEGWIVFPAGHHVWGHGDLRTGGVLLFAVVRDELYRCGSPVRDGSGHTTPEDMERACRRVTAHTGLRPSASDRWHDSPAITVRVADADTAEPITILDGRAISNGWAIFGLDTGSPELVDHTSRRLRFTSPWTTFLAPRGAIWPDDLLPDGTRWSDDTPSTEADRALALDRFRRAVRAAHEGRLSARSPLDHPIPQLANRRTPPPTIQPNPTQQEGSTP